jgi:hypothetical protein
MIFQIIWALRLYIIVYVYEYIIGAFVDEHLNYFGVADLHDDFEGRDLGVGGLGETFMTFSTCLSILMSSQYIAECIKEPCLNMLVTLILIFR